MAAPVNQFATSPLVHDLPSWTTTSPLDIKSWLMKVNQLKFACNATDEQVIRLVGLKMNCQRSINYVQTLITSYEQAGVYDWAAFRAALVQEFDTPVDDWQLEVALSALKQQANQSVLQYAKLFEAEASRSTSLSNFRKCHIFATTLSTEALRTAATTAYASARMAGVDPSVQKVASSLSLLKEAQVQPTPRSQVQVQQMQYVPNQRSNDQSRDRGHWNRNADQRTSQAVAQGGPAHQLASAPQPAAGSSQDARRAPLGPCFKCGSREHYSRFCPTNGNGGQRGINNINSTTTSSRFATPVIVNQSYEAIALVDTGAQANVLHVALLQHIWPKPDLQRSSRSLIGPNQEVLAVVGDVSLEVYLHNHDRTFLVHFNVIKECSYDLILGDPFLHNHVDVISCSTGGLTLYDQVPAGPVQDAAICQLTEELSHTNSQVKTAVLQRLQPNVVSVLELVTSGFDDCHQQPALFTPHAEAGVNLGLGGEPFLILCSANKLSLPVLNRSSVPITLLAGVPIGTVEHVDVSESALNPSASGQSQQSGSQLFGHSGSAIIASIVVSANSVAPAALDQVIPAVTVSEARVSPSSSVSADAHATGVVSPSVSLGSTSITRSGSSSVAFSSPDQTASLSTQSTDGVTAPLRSVYLAHLDQSVSLDETTSVTMTDEQFVMFSQLVMAFRHIFGKLLESTATSVVQHHIITGDHRPVHVRPYRTPVHLRETLRQEIDSMLRAGVIVPSNSPWSASVVMVTKQDGSQRICMDYRRLNSVTIRDTYPIPRIQDLLDSLAGKAHVFSTLDLLSGFYQVEVHPDDRAKTAFSTEFGHWEFVRMPFGLCNAPATFQRLMDVVLNEVRGFARCYIDDLIIFSHSVDQHMEHLSKVFDLLLKAGLIVKPSKCKFLRTTVRFLGHQVSAGVVAPDPDKTEAIKSWPTPSNRHDLQVALGLFNYYRRFVPNFSTIADPLNRLLRKGVVWLWNDSCEQAFICLKRFLTSSPILALPNFNMQFIVHCDASATGLGAVLCQMIHGIEKVVAYGSKSLNQAQKRYSATDRECLAVHWAINHWRAYLLGKQFIVVTDHLALKWLFSSSRRDPHHRHDRLILDLQQYDFVVTHRAGTLHGNADALSRAAELIDIPTSSSVSTTSTSSLAVNAISRSQTGSLPARQPRLDSQWIGRDEERDMAKAIKQSFEDSELSRINLGNLEETWADDLADNTSSSPSSSNNGTSSSSTSSTSSSADHQHDDVVSTINLVVAQREDDDLYALIIYLRRGELPADHALAQWVRQQAQHCVIQHDNLLVTTLAPQSAHDVSVPSRPFIPTTLRSLLLAHYHDDAISAHLGEDKTFSRLSLRYYWPHMRHDVTHYVKTCTSCQKRKSPPHMGVDSVGVPDRPSYPFERISIDVLGPLPASGRNNRYCLCVMDLFTRFPFIFALPNQRTATVATTLIEKVFLEHGFPGQVLSDRGSNFVSHLMEEVFALLTVRHVTTLAYSPQTNGVVERFNHTLLTMMSHYVLHDQHDWDMWIPYVLFAFRSSPHSILGHSPFFMVYGREPNLPLEHALGTVGINRPFLRPNQEAYLSDIASRMALARDIAAKRLDAVDRARIIANSHITHLRQFTIGDKVMRWQPQLRDPSGRSRKLAQQWEGPFEVIDKMESTNTYKIVALGANGRPTSAKPTICQATRLKRYHDRATLTSSAPAHVATIRALSLLMADACHSSLLHW
jgi:hypothetical protein